MPTSQQAALQSDWGKYQILRLLARGGMAEVYLARAKGLQGFEKLVVIKRILPVLSADPAFVEMFLNEARIAAQLQHTNVVQVYDMGSVGDAYFFSMEFLHGQDLRTVWKTASKRHQRLPLEHVLYMMSSVCAGLHYAHEKLGFDGQHLGLVHRDMSPHNVFVTYDGAVKVVDFGIVKATQRETQTPSGMLKGKVSYMAPEQCRIEVVDRRADLWSVGVMLWELLTGKMLFSGKGDFEIMQAICEHDAPRPSAIAPCDAEVEAIVMKALTRDRDARYQTAHELQEDLEELARERKLKLSAHGVSRHMREEFAAQIALWESAKMEGKSLGEHLSESTPPIGPHASAPASSRPPPASRADAPEAGAASVDPQRGGPTRTVATRMAMATPSATLDPQRAGPDRRLLVIAATCVALLLTTLVVRKLLSRPSVPIEPVESAQSLPEVATPSAPVSAPSALVPAPSESLQPEPKAAATSLEPEPRPGPPAPQKPRANEARPSAEKRRPAVERRGVEAKGKSKPAQSPDRAQDPLYRGKLPDSLDVE